MNRPFDVVIPEGEDAARVYHLLILQMADYYEDVLATRTQERDFHEAQSREYLDRIAQLEATTQTIAVPVIRKARSVARRVFRL